MNWVLVAYDHAAEIANVYGPYTAYSTALIAKRRAFAVLAPTMPSPLHFDVVLLSLPSDLDGDVTTLARETNNGTA